MILEIGRKTSKRGFARSRGGATRLKYSSGSQSTEVRRCGRDVGWEYER